jgi:hypothetical protein
MKKKKAFTIEQFLDFAQKLNTVPMPFGGQRSMGVETTPSPMLLETGHHTQHGVMIHSMPSSGSYSHASHLARRMPPKESSLDEEEEDDDDDVEESEYGEEDEAEDAPKIPAPPVSLLRIPKKTIKEASSKQKKRSNK